MILTVLRILILLGVVFTIVLLVDYIKKNKDSDRFRENISFGKRHAVYNAVVALIANFLCACGVGTHAVNAIGFKFAKSVEDGNMPGTMNIGAVVPCCLAACYIVTDNSEIDVVTMLSMVIAAILGAFLLAGIIGKLNTLGIRLLLGLGLIIMSAFILIRSFEVGNVGNEGTEYALAGYKLAIAVVCSFVFGALMNIGVGYYAPVMVVLSLLGLDFSSSLTIVLVSTAILLAFGNTPRLIKTGKFDLVAVITQFIFGSVGAALVYFLVLPEIPMDIIAIIIGALVLVTGIIYISDYFRGLKAAKR